MQKNFKPSETMKALEDLGWVKYFRPAMKGQFFFLPRGVLVFNIMEEFLRNWVSNELKSLEIRTPIMYEWEESSIQSESANFAERVYLTKADNKEIVLRPGGDYGVFSLLTEQNLTETQFPLSFFEIAASFRKNLKRELAGLLRANFFTLVDHHTFTASIDQAWDAYFAIILSQAKLGDFFELPWKLTFQVENNFFQGYQGKFQFLEKRLNKRIEIKKLDKQTNYWTAQHHFVDESDNIGFSDGQFDLVNSKNYNIKYLSREGKERKYPIICHGSFDSVERWIFKLVNKALPLCGANFPLWLFPIHIRFIVNNLKHLPLIEAQRQKLAKKGIRSESDIKKRAIQKRVANSYGAWVPYTITFPEDFRSFDNSVFTVHYLDSSKEKINMASFLSKINGDVSCKAIDCLAVNV